MCTPLTASLLCLFSPALLLALQLPELPASLQELGIVECIAFRKLPQLMHTSMCALCCGHCPELTDLPDLPDSLTSLTVPGLPRVTRLPRLCLDSLQQLNVNSTAISELPSPLSRIRQLYCQHTPIRQLPVLGSCCERLYLGSCSELQHLPEQLPLSLLTLDCSGCSNLQRLPQQLPLSLLTLNCSGCSSLQGLPEQLTSGLEHLRLEDCLLVEQLPDLPTTLKTLFLTGCSSLRQLPDLSKCQLQHPSSVKGCTALREMRVGGNTVRLQ
jgi:hypothetical protein